MYIIHIFLFHITVSESLGPAVWCCIVRRMLTARTVCARGIRERHARVGSLAMVHIGGEVGAWCRELQEDVGGSGAQCAV